MLIPWLTKVLVDEVATEGRVDLLTPVLVAMRALALATAGAGVGGSHRAYHRASLGDGTQVADRIVLLDEGRVRDVGRHDERYTRDDLYRRLCGLQFLQLTPTN